MEHIRAFRRRPHGIFGDVGFYIPELQIIACVQHAAVGITPAAHQIPLGFLRGGDEHGRAVEVLREKSLADLRAEIPQIDTEGIAACRLDVFQRLYHVDFALHDAHRAFVYALCAVSGSVRFHQCFSPVYR